MTNGVGAPTAPQHKQRRQLFLASNGGYFFKGYREIFRRYFFRAKEQPLHPAAA